MEVEQQPSQHTHKQNQTVPAVQPSSSTYSFNVQKVKGKNTALWITTTDGHVGLISVLNYGCTSNVRPKLLGIDLFKCYLAQTDRIYCII